jgi:UDP-N-acetylmuramoyl-L-alanyl-D-glutamate--2,6-diaminopimelate ligase
MFIECKNNDVKVIVMEVSSQAISYGRVDGLEFDIACFTNLTQDHLDYHLSMDNYMNEKLKLFKMLRGEKIAIINQDDPRCNIFALDENKNYFYGENSSDFKIFDTHLSMDGSQFKIESNFKLQNKKNIFNVELSLPGKYNIYNYMNAFICALQLGFETNEIINFTKELKSPDGRYDLVNYRSSYIIVDYAHSPDAVENILNSIDEYKKGKVYTVVGCGGNRDSKKRPIMGKISIEKSDYVIFTNDNPRLEDEKQIMNDIIKDLDKANYEVIYDRAEAIKKGISLLEDNDVLLILGKGHEPYQIIGNIKHHFSDKEEVLKYIEKA